MNFEQTENEEVDYLDNNFLKVEQDFEKLDEINNLKIEVDQGLEEAFAQLEELKSKFSQNEGDALIEQCKTTVIETITGQFGLASLFIESKDGGNVTTTHNYEKGITSTEKDQETYDKYKANKDGTNEWSDVRKKAGYDKHLPRKRKEVFQEKNTVIDEYTGKSLPKDRAHLDHVVPVKEIESSPKVNLCMTKEERVEMASSEGNLAFTDGRINQSKGDKKMDVFLGEKDSKTGQTKSEKYDIDENEARRKDKDARKEINKKITSATFQKQSKELLLTGAKDAGKMIAVSVIGVVMRDFVQDTFQAIKEAFGDRKNKSFKELFSEFKEKMKVVISNIKKKWKETLKSSIEGGITAFFSNLLIFVINLFATTLKKIVTMIRAGFVSLVKAVKIMANPPKGMSQEEARYQAAKIMIAGLIGVASLGLSAGIEKFLQVIPGLAPIMIFSIPSFGGELRTVSDIIAVTLSSLLGGLLATLAIYLMDRFRREGQKNKLQIQMVYQSGVVVDYKVAQSWLVLNDAYSFFANRAIETLEVASKAEADINDSIDEVRKSSDGYSVAVERMRKLRQKRSEHQN